MNRVASHNISVRVRNGRAKISIGSHNRGSVLVGQRSVSGRYGLVLVGGQIAICLVRLYDSSTVAVWSIGMYSGRAKTAKGSVGFPGILQRSIAVERLQ